jgi:hypothetical protein
VLSLSGVAIRENYHFSKSVKNPYSKQLKEQVTIDLEKDIIQYFEEIAQETGISYLNLINLYLRECNDKYGCISHYIEVLEKTIGKLTIECDEIWSLNV